MSHSNLEVSATTLLPDVLHTHLCFVREDPPVLDKNEWEVIGIGQTIYTLSNTTQFGVDSSKVYCKCHMAIASCNTLKIQQVANPLHRGFSYWICNPSQRPKAKF